MIVEPAVRPKPPKANRPTGQHKPPIAASPAKGSRSCTERSYPFAPTSAQRDAQLEQRSSSTASASIQRSRRSVRWPFDIETIRRAAPNAFSERSHASAEPWPARLPWVRAGQGRAGHCDAMLAALGSSGAPRRSTPPRPGPDAPYYTAPDPGARDVRHAGDAHQILQHCVLPGDGGPPTPASRRRPHHNGANPSSTVSSVWASAPDRTPDDGSSYAG
jgi:hypothetical protein